MSRRRSAPTLSNPPHTFRRYPDMGHTGITSEVIKRSLEFIEQQTER